MIEVRDLTFAYPESPPVLAGLSWAVMPGETWAVIGQSGCGKSTLLYLLAGLRRPTQGAILIGGQPLTGARQRTGLILQDFGLLPWATASENVALGLRLRGVSDERRRTAVDAWIERLELAHVAGHFPAELSGGQRQRVAIARTLILDPDLLLMDEPFAALDTLTREGLQNLILTLGREPGGGRLASPLATSGDRQGITIVIVTHNIEEAAFLGQHILLLGAGPNREARVVHNPWSGDVDFRNDAMFAALCRELRALLTSSGLGVEYQSA